MAFDPYTLMPSALGFPMLDAPPVNPFGGPVGDGRISVPHYTSFNAIYNTFGKNYRWFNGDEALQASIHNSKAMRRDPVIFSALRARQKPTALLNWHIEPRDPADPLQVQAAKTHEQIILESPNFQQVKMWLLEALWFGRYGVQIAYEWTYDYEGRQMMRPRQYFPVNGDKLVFRYDGTPGIRVHSTWMHAQIDNTTISDYGRVYWFNEQERESLLIHKFEPEDADFTDPELAGAVHGVGLRSKLYWAWALKNKVQGLLFDYLNWFARGLTIYYYEKGNDAAFQEVQQRITDYAGQPYLVFPKTNDGGPNWSPVERIEPGTASQQLLQSLATDYYDVLMRTAILDQTLSTGTGATGLGSGVSDLHQTSFDQVIKYDSNGLANTLTEGMLRPLYRTNNPGMPCGRWMFELDAVNVTELIESAQTFYEMGGAIDEDTFRDDLGLARPKQGGSVLSKIDSTQPAAVDGMPTGVPVVQGQPQDMPNQQSPPQQPGQQVTQSQGQAQ